MDAAPAAPDLRDATTSSLSAVPVPAAAAVERQGAPRRPPTTATSASSSTSSTSSSFIGPRSRPEPGAAGGGGLDAVLPVGLAAATEGTGTSSNGVHEQQTPVHGKEGQGVDQELGGNGDDDDDDDDDDEHEMMADLADVDVHIPLQDMDDSETDDDDNGRNVDPSVVDNEATAGAPSLANGWDDNAVASCFERAIQMHSMTAEELAHETSGGSGWEAGPNVLPPTVTRSTENAAAAGNLAENNERTTEQPICNAAKSEVVATSISHHFGENEGESSEQDDQKKSWKPRPLPLPAWAVDPIYAAASITSRGLGGIN